MRQNIFLLLISVLLIASACSDDDTPSAEEAFLADLAGTWEVTEVTLDDETVTGEFDNMTISFDEDKTYSVTNPVGNIWPASGMFELQEASGDLFNLVRDDAVIVSVDELADSRVVLSFQFDSAPGRQRGLAGEYIFTLTK